MNERQPIILYPATKDKPLGICVSGTRYSGKDTFSQELHTTLQRRGIQTVVRSTSRRLKERFCAQHHIDEQTFLTDRTVKEQYREQFSQWVATQSVAENAEQFMNSLVADFLLMEVIIISDLRSRYDYNQFSFIFPAFMSVRIETASDIKASRGYTHTLYDHSVFETEVSQIPYDYLVHNDGPIEALRASAEKISTSIVVEE